MMQIAGQFLRFVLLCYSRTVLTVAVVAGMASAWGYYGYQRMGCHPMFASANVECGTVQTMSAEHAMAMARAVVPYQQVLRDNQQALTQAVGMALVLAMLIEIMLAVLRIILRRRKKRTLTHASAELSGKAE